MAKMQILGEMVYPRLNSKKSYGPVDKGNDGNANMNSGNVFSNDTNNTLNQMRNKY